MTYSQITTDVSPDSPAESNTPPSETGYANGHRMPGGNGFPGSGARHVLARVQELGESASWVTWAILGSAVAALASFRPLIHQTSTDTIAHFQIKDGVIHASLIIGILILGMTILARQRPQFRIPAAITSLVMSLAMLSLYGLLTIAGLIGLKENVGFGFYERFTWLPGMGMLFSFAGYGAIVIASILAFTQRPTTHTGTP